MIAKGNHIFLRLPETGDEEVMLKWENDESLWEVSNTKEKFSLEDIKDFIGSNHNIIRHKQLRLMICEVKGGRQIGCIDLFEYDKDHKRAGVGILIYEESDKKKGYASQALDLLATYCLKELNLKQLFCNVLADNAASLGLFEKNGFTTIGKKIAWHRSGDLWKDEFIMQRILS